MSPELHSHVKHIIWALALGGTVVGGLVARGKYEAYITDRMAKRDEVVSANQVIAAQGKKDSQIDQNTVTARDAQNAKDIAVLQAKYAQQLTPAQMDAIIASRLAGMTLTQGKDAQGNATTTVGTAALADTLNKATITQAICDSKLGTCEADKANLNQAIGKLNGTIIADEETMKLQRDQVKDLQKFQVPRWTMMLGAGKSQGSSFQQASSYQPVLGIDYRLTNRFGIFGLAQNKSAAAGISWHFGAIR